ncbi:MAG: hypothetical protein AAGD43_03460 [Pseudomonadota bacterium]
MSSELTQIIAADAVNYISSLISLTILVFIICWLYIDYHVDGFRQRMFRIRDKLFDDMKLHGIDYSHPAHVHLRTVLNGYIRMAHRINPWSMLLLAWLEWRDVKQNFSIMREDRSSLMDDLSAEQRRVFEKLIARSQTELVRFMIVSSPILVATVFVPALVYWALRHAVGWLLATLHYPIARMEIIAASRGRPATQ